MMKLVHARTGEQRTVSAKKSAKNRFMDVIVMHLPLSMRKYITNVFPFSGAVAGMLFGPAISVLGGIPFFLNARFGLFYIFMERRL